MTFSKILGEAEANVSKIIDLESSSEQIFSENWRWVPLNIFQCLLFSNEIPLIRRSSSCPCVTVAILSLVYINDLSTIMNYASTRMDADNTNLTFIACGIPELQHDMNVDLRYLQNWLIANRLTLNMLIKDLIRFIHSLSRKRQNRESKRKALIVPHSSPVGIDTYGPRSRGILPRLHFRCGFSNRSV